jgi:hypothetical protein
MRRESAVHSRVETRARRLRRRVLKDLTPGCLSRQLAPEARRAGAWRRADYPITELTPIWLSTALRAGGLSVCEVFLIAEISPQGDRFPRHNASRRLLALCEPDPTAKQNGGTGDQRHERAREERSEPPEVHEHQVAQIR